jgi:hypothetical protein
LSIGGPGSSVATADFAVVPEIASANAKLLKRVAWRKYTQWWTCIIQYYFMLIEREMEENICI